MYKELRPFHFFCQKVIPLSYDASLSYYELLCKVVEYLNNTMADVNTLKNYIDHYFDSADVQQMINDKLDEMAEEGTILQPDSIKAETLDRSQFSPVNALAFGIKNDGSEDISAIVNEVTEDYALYFPCGTYKVSNPISLKNPIYGGGYSRKNTVDGDGYTWFVSDIINADHTESVFTIETDKNINIENLNIYLNTGENGITLKDNRQYNRIENVNVSNISGMGVYGANDSEAGFASRGLFMDSFSMFANPNYPLAATGIYLSDYIGDCRFTNGEIMGCVYGMVLNNRVNHIEDIHIWDGCMRGTDPDQWWTSTIGILCRNGCRLTGTNLYLDTCHSAFYVYGNGCDITLKNVIYVEDNSIYGNNAYDGTFLFTGDRYSRINIDGGIITFRGDTETPAHLEKIYNRMNPNTKLENITIVSDYPINVANQLKYDTGRPSDTAPVSYTLPLYSDTDDRYIEIAKIPYLPSTSGFVQLMVTQDTGEYDVINVRKVSGSALSVSLSEDSIGGVDFYYKADTTNGIVIYAKVAATGSTALYWTTVEQVIHTANYGSVDYSNIRRRTPVEGSNEVVRDILTSDTGLTSIT